MTKIFILNHTLDSNENLARHLTKDDKTSIKDGLLMLLKMFKDGDKDSLALSNEPKAEEIDPRSNMDAEQSWREEAESRQGTGNHSEKINSPRNYLGYIVNFISRLIFEILYLVRI